MKHLFKMKDYKVFYCEYCDMSSELAAEILYEYETRKQEMMHKPFDEWLKVKNQILNSHPCLTDEEWNIKSIIK